MASIWLAALKYQLKRNYRISASECISGISKRLVKNFNQNKVIGIEQIEVKTEFAHMLKDNTEKKHGVEIEI